MGLKLLLLVICLKYAILCQSTLYVDGDGTVPSESAKVQKLVILEVVHISILERNELKSIHWTAGAVVPFIGYALALFIFYSTVPVLLKISGSTMLNLSLLTSDMWAVLIRIFAYKEKVDWMYFVAFGAVSIGLVVYSGGSKEETQATAQVAGANNNAEVPKEGDEEAGIQHSIQETVAGSSKTGGSKHRS